MQTVFHAEISNLWSLLVLCNLHVFLEVAVNAVVELAEFVVVLEFLHAVDGNFLEENSWVVPLFAPQVNIDALEHCRCFVVPSPPEVVGYFLQTFELLREVRLYFCLTPDR